MIVKENSTLAFRLQQLQQVQMANPYSSKAWQDASKEIHLLTGAKDACGR